MNINHNNACFLRWGGGEHGQSNLPNGQSNLSDGIQAIMEDRFYRQHDLLHHRQSRRPSIQITEARENNFNGPALIHY